MGEAAKRLFMNEPVIRPMIGTDVDGVMAVEQLSFSTPWTRAAFEAEVEDNSLARYLVLDDNGTIAGFAGMWLILDEAHITNIAIHPGYRGCGLGEKLVQAIIDYARQLGATAMTLEVRVSNVTAQQLYTKLGFEAKGKRRGYYSDTGEDALIMWKVLGSA